MLTVRLSDQPVVILEDNNDKGYPSESLNDRFMSISSADCGSDQVRMVVVCQPSTTLTTTQDIPQKPENHKKEFWFSPQMMRTTKMKKLRIVFVSTVMLVCVAAMQSAFAGDKKDHAFTGWAFVFNNPAACVDGCNGPDLCAADGAVIYLTGQRVQKNGRATFAGQISANSLHRVIGPGPCLNNGLIDPINAEIHVGLDDHGEGSLTGDADSKHQETTNPGSNIRQVATFLSGAAAGSVSYTSNGATVPGSSARITRLDTGVSITIDTRFNFDDDDDDSDSDSDSD